MPNAEGLTPRLFGTDGIRGVAGAYPLDPPTVRRVGAALVRAMSAVAAPTDRLRFLVGRDTRESGPWIEAELARGATSEGASVTSVGIAPTPAVAYLTRAAGYDAGLVISASHNPFEDNGIKMFSGAGEKFTERLERAVEDIVADRTWAVSDGTHTGVPHADLIRAYLDHLQGVFPEASMLGPFRLAIDCANGATTTVAPSLFRGLGFDATVIANQPNGRNINLHCGSMHPETLAQTVLDRGCRMGIAFDGDGDRAIFVDEHGAIVNGDAVLLMCAAQLQREGRLKGGTIVATVMSNVGLELALRSRGIDLVRTAVGDKYVMEEMLARGLSLGGEQSGHIIFAEYLFTGDGLCTALNVLRVMAMTGRTLSDLASDLTTYPQVLLNVRVREKADLASVPSIASAVSRVETRMAGHGRLVVRYSGTEPLLRVMIEGEHEQEIRAWAQEIADVVTTHLG